MVAPPERQPALDRQLELFKGLVSQNFEQEEEIDASLTADQQGIGSGQDVIATDNQPNGHLPNEGEGRRSRRPGPAN